MKIIAESLSFSEFGRAIFNQTGAASEGSDPIYGAQPPDVGGGQLVEWGLTLPSSHGQQFITDIGISFVHRTWETCTISEK